MKHFEKSLIVLLTLLSMVSCDIIDDIPYPIRISNITDFAVEGQCDDTGKAPGKSTITDKTVQLYVCDTVDLNNVTITRFEVTNDAVIVPDDNAVVTPARFPKASFSKIPTGSDTRANFSESRYFTLKTYQDYRWKIEVTRIINREIQIEGMANAVIDANTRNVVIWMDTTIVKEKDFNKLRIKKFTLGGEHGTVTDFYGVDIQAVGTYDFSNSKTLFVTEGWDKTQSKFQWQIYTYPTKGGGNASDKPSGTDDKPKAQIYNPGFENWWVSGKINYPNETGKSYWDSSNGGSANYIGSNVLQSTSFKHSGNSCAKLESKWAAIKLAAGGLYTGNFIGLLGIKGAKMDWGVPFTDKPKALKGFMSYTPGPINRGDQPEGAPAKNTPDHYSIFIALTSEQLHVGGNADGDDSTTGLHYEKTTTFDWQNDPRVIAYGEVTGSQNDNGEWREFNIELDYHKDTTPSYMVIVVSSSKWGDYFYGSDQTVLYVDDFELVY